MQGLNYLCPMSKSNLRFTLILRMTMRVDGVIVLQKNTQEAKGGVK